MNINNTINIYKTGDANFICDTCGRKRKRSEGTLSYGTGDIAVLMTCLDTCTDYRHPLNSPPPIIFDGQPVPDARPDMTQDSNSPQWYVVNTVASLMSWGHFQPTGAWGTLNFGNSSFNTDPVWTWGAFTRN